MPATKDKGLHVTVYAETADAVLKLQPRMREPLVQNDRSDLDRRYRADVPAAPKQ